MGHSEKTHPTSHNKDRKIQVMGPVPRKMVKFNPGLSQILRRVFLSKNMSLELTIYFCVFTLKFSDDNTQCFSKQCIGR